MNDSSTHTGRGKFARILADLAKRIASNLITKLALLTIASYWLFTGGIGAIQSIMVFMSLVFLTVGTACWLLLKWATLGPLKKIVTRHEAD